jgi:hypothetical protein
VTAALDPQVTRSKGILVGGFNPGGGHSGIDATLDALVVDAAARLRELCGQAVEIRFGRRVPGGRSDGRPERLADAAVVPERLRRR